MSKRNFGEGCHWYDANGAVPTVPNAKGDKQIAPDVRHARKLGLVPGCTSVIDILAKPQLVQWFKTSTAEAAWAFYANPDFSHDDEATFDKGIFVYTILEMQAEHAAEAKEGGKQIHAALEMYLLDGRIVPGFGHYIETAKQALDSVGLDLDDFIGEVDGYHRLGYGCRGDLLSVKDNGVYVDIKTRDFSHADKIKPYDGDPLQVVANIQALPGLSSRARGMNLYLSRSDAKAWKVVEYTEEELATAWTQFKACLMIFQTMKGLPCPQLEGSA